MHLINYLRFFPLLILLLLILITGCASVTQLSIESKLAKPTYQSATLLAGMSEVDITPPPGMPKAGYAAWADDGMGFRTRLYARVFYLKPKEGRPIAIVQTDLLSGSTVLHQKIAEQIAAHTDINAQNLTITATHNHAGPGQFFGNNFYNAFASNRGGFDPNWFDFLVKRISAGIIDAYQNKRPAKIATGEIKIWGLTRNRSFEPYANNSFIKNKKLRSERKYKAINPSLYLVRIDIKDKDGRYKPKGAFSTFSIHGTGVPRFTELYNADVWAYISQELEWSIKENYSIPWEPIHGPFEGTHADMAPNERFGSLGYIEAKRVGSGIAQYAWKLFQSLDDKLTDDIVIRSALREVDVFQENTVADISLCERPVVGTALAGGAKEHMSPVIAHLPFIAAGWPRWVFTGGCQGHKRWLGSSFQRLILSKDDFPHKLLFQSMQIHDMALVLLPFEITAASGRHIAQQVKKTYQQLSETINYIAVSSVANGYTGYAVTPEEYTLQYYEGGHTLYGPQTTPYLAVQSAQLIQEMVNHESFSDLPSRWDYTFKTNNYFPTEQLAIGKRYSKFVPEFHDANENQEAYWAFRWYDVSPAGIHFHEQLIGVEYQDAENNWRPLLMDGRPVNDTGYDIAVVYKDKTDRKKMGLYEVHWYNPEFNGDRQYRFVIAARNNQEIFYSPAFFY